MSVVYANGFQVNIEGDGAARFVFEDNSGVNPQSGHVAHVVVTPGNAKRFAEGILDALKRAEEARALEAAKEGTSQ